MQFPKVIAHRGASGYAPENTLIAMETAKKLGATWVEFDVQLSADGEAVIIHDDTLDRTTDGTGRVADKTLLELKKLDAGSWFANEFVDEKIPSFQELLQCLMKLNLQMNIEIKPSAGSERETVVRVLDVLKAAWPAHLPKPLLSSFNVDCLFLLRELNASYPLAMLMHDWKDDWQATASELKCVSVNVNQAVLTPARVAEIKEAGFALLSYAINDKQGADALFSWGVDGIFTDLVDQVM